jgi:hypothetical protein
MRPDLKNQIRGVLKTIGAVVSHSEKKGFNAKLRATMKGNQTLQKIVKPLPEAPESVQQQTTALDLLVEKYAQDDTICRPLMTIPGVGAVTAVAYTTAVDESTGRPSGTIEDLVRGPGAGPNIRGALVGRNVLFCGDDPAAIAEAINQFVHRRTGAIEAIGQGGKIRGTLMDAFG